MATADDNQKSNPTGFSGLSTLASDVEEENRPASKYVPGVVPSPSDPAAPEHPSMLAGEDPTYHAPQTPKGKRGDISDATTGKWMVGIGLGIGVLLIVLVNSTKNESHRPAPASVAQALPPAIAPDAPSVNQPPTQRQTGQATLSHRSAAMESVEVLGQQFFFSNPSGYCTPGASAWELELIDLARRSLGEGSRLVHAAFRCSELEDYGEGRREMLDHWLQIQLLGPEGNFRRIEMQREAFLSGLSKVSPRVSPAELNRRLKASLENSDISLSDTKVEPIGRDGNAIYFSLQTNMSVGEASRPISGLSGVTLLNSLPMSINVYEGTGSAQSRDQLQAVLQDLLNSLLTEN